MIDNRSVLSQAMWYVEELNFQQAKGNFMNANNILSHDFRSCYRIVFFFYWYILHLYLTDLTHAATPKSLQSCLTLCDPIDGSPPGSAVPEILQARTLEWVAISFSNVWKWKLKVKSLSRVWLLATSWTVAYQAPPSMGFSRQEWGAISFSELWYINKTKWPKSRNRKWQFNSISVVIQSNH